MARTRTARAGEDEARTAVAGAPPAPGASPAPAVAAAADAGVSFQVLRLDQVAESPHNTRKHFDPAALAELAESLKASGQLEPVVVRPHPSGHGVFELAAGHRRLRAAKMAGLPELLAIVRPMDDATFIELLAVSNLQREDVHALEEADGYAQMMTELGWDVAKIAQRVGKSESYIYDSLKLRTLIDPIRDSYFAGRIQRAHAVELSHLSASEQKRAFDPYGGGLWESTGYHPLTSEEELGLVEDDEASEDAVPADYKPRTVRELKAWIQRHVRFDATAEHVPQLFPETHRALEVADVAGAKVVQITYSHHVHDDAREKGVRTVGPRSWKRADGLFESAECDHGVLGVVVVGPGQGEAFTVCLAKETCKTHWGKEIAEKARATKAGAVGGSRKGQVDRWREEEAARQARRAEEDRQLAAISSALPALLDAIATSVAKAPAGGRGNVAQLLLSDKTRRLSHGRRAIVERVRALKVGTGADDVVRALGTLAYWEKADDLSRWVGNSRELFKFAKSFGIDLKALVDAALKKTAPAAEPKPEKGAKAATGAKRKARKRTAKAKGGR